MILIKKLKNRLYKSLAKRILSSYDVDPSQSTYGSIFHDLKEINALKYSVKQEGYKVSQELYKVFKKSPVPESSNNFLPLKSMACKQSDLETEWFRYWCNEIKLSPLPHRKLWEFAYILNCLLYTSPSPRD